MRTKAHRAALFTTKSSLQFLPSQYKNTTFQGKNWSNRFFYLSNENWGLTTAFRPIPSRSPESMLKSCWWFGSCSDGVSTAKVFLRGRNRVNGTLGRPGECLDARDRAAPWCEDRKRVYPSASSSSLKLQSASV